MILITGATGFIGSHLTEELVKRKEKVTILVRDDNLGFIKDFPEEVRKKIKIVKGDLLDKESLIKSLKNIEKVFHLAAISHPMNIPKQVYYDINVRGTENLLEACKIKKIKKIIHVSTMSIFGFSRDGKPLNENSPKLPVSDYGASKKIGEEKAIDFCKKNKIKIIVVRPPMVFGPRDMQFLKLFQLINTGFFPLLRGGRAKIEFCYVKNLVNGILLADKYGKNLEAYNFSDGETYTIKKVFGEIARAENKNLFPISAPVWVVKTSGAIMQWIYSIFGKKAPFNSGTADWMSKNNVLDITKSKKELGYKTVIPLEISIRETIKWYKEKRLL
ncbi:L-arabinose 1-dehydrogenase (NAD(P)(+)) [uncultured archaeon]|nr:L-arabinose 1-dehydrogenase (NAD(P)(+)) [uncultured archaeon]